MRNLQSPLSRPGRRRGMAEYDRLPPALRRWLATAVLPWSPRSALRIWRAAGSGDVDRALARLAAAEAATLAREARIIDQRKARETAGGGAGHAPKAAVRARTTRTAGNRAAPVGDEDRARLPGPNLPG